MPVKSHTFWQRNGGEGGSLGQGGAQEQQLQSRDTSVLKMASRPTADYRLPATGTAPAEASMARTGTLSPPPTHVKGTWGRQGRFPGQVCLPPARALKVGGRHSLWPWAGVQQLCARGRTRTPHPCGQNSHHVSDVSPLIPHPAFSTSPSLSLRLLSLQAPLQSNWGRDTPFLGCSSAARSTCALPKESIRVWGASAVRL